MNYKIGLVGLPNVGKSSFFNLLTKKNILVANYPFATIEKNFGILILKDERLEKLKNYWKSEKISFSSIKIVDIPGLVKGASQGLGLGNEFLSNIRDVDIIFHIIRCFPEKEIIHIEGKINPIRDFEMIKLELIISDLQQIEKKSKKIKKPQQNDKEWKILNFIKKKLQEEKMINELIFNEEEKKIIKRYDFLTNKPFFFLLNYNDDEKELKNFKEYAIINNFKYFPINIKKEEILNEKFEKKDIFSFLITNIYKMLNLKTFFTVGKDEVKSWLVKKNYNAKECSGLIHSDIKNKFIKLEVYNYFDWLVFPDKEILKKNGKIRKEGANYLVKDGDICYFLFGN